jgi:hypothetical protein
MFGYEVNRLGLLDMLKKAVCIYVHKNTVVWNEIPYSLAEH